MPLFIIAVFVIGYALISLEHPLKLEKAAIALLMGGLCWVLLAFSGISADHLLELLGEHMNEIAGIAFFLMGAMTIVEVIDSHNGFSMIPRLISTTRKRGLLVVVSFLAFFMSALLDNLTTTIVMIAISRKLLNEKEDFLVFAGMIVIAANAGGVFSPIGDITTTMLWIGGQLSVQKIIVSLFLPSLVAMLIPLAGTLLMVKGTARKPEPVAASSTPIKPGISYFVLLFGIVLLASVPVVRIATNLPPYMAILFALGVLWLTTELLRNSKLIASEGKLTVSSALREIDMPSVLFFVGILLGVAALQGSGSLAILANWLTVQVGNIDIVMILMGLISAVVDNVPLVSAAINMFPLDQYPMDSRIWELLAFTAGTGGSLLIIGSAAGITAMGASKISFGWYAKRFTVLAFLGFAAGVGVFYLING